MRNRRAALLAPAASLLLLGACQDSPAEPQADAEQTAPPDNGEAAGGTAGEHEESAKDQDAGADSGEAGRNGGENGKDEEGESPNEQRDQLLSEIDDQAGQSTDLKPALPPADAGDGNYLGAAVQAEADHYEVDYFSTDQPYQLNAGELEDLEPFAKAEGRIYESPAAAKESVNYQQVPEGSGNVDLGYGITGTEDAGAGSVFLTWHEGKWSFSMRNQNIDNPGGSGDMTALAKKIVAKLEDRMLPPPEEAGAGTFDLSSDEYSLAWQRGKVVYSISADDPLKLIDLAADLSE
ncbi:hypothetical protein [Edaphobacillus lindanitolerans]|uniref:Lipoprotein n=1 Tax=Edaphobacillus lindanitolerans TaxID=550447 RepID=A0A1U7PRG4_9BACI|nr:hypothetical protein [Edaphobacillus lindanitolerans]SIT88152.1 hypothetical protein SAMN05428946_2231 [Edaphobacillus lindanitolerans]